MKRVVPILCGGLFLTALAAAPARAASGTLIVDGESYGNPSGCVTPGDSTIPLAIANNTDVTVQVYSSTHCSDYSPKGSIPPGDSATFDAGSIAVG